MAILKGSSTPDVRLLLDAGAQRPHRNDATSVAVAWPVWRIAAQIELRESRSRQDLDHFETAVLDLAAAGVTDAASAAADLGLDRELVKRIWRSLQGAKLIGDMGATPEGHERLERLTATTTTIVSGWVLIDAVTDRPWPRFPPVLEAWAPRVDENPLPLRQLREASVPDSSTLRSVVRNAEIAGRSWSTATRVRGLPNGLARVLDDKPQLVRMRTWIYRDRRTLEDGTALLDATLRVCDPCGPGDAPYLEEALPELRTKDKALDQLIRRRLSDASGGSSDPKLVSEEADRMRQSVLTRLSPPVPRDHPALAPLADALALRWLGWEDRSLADLSSALESVLLHVTTAEQREAALARLDGQDEEFVVMLETALTRCGFRPEVPHGVVTSIGGGEHRHGSVRALAGLTVLIAADDEEHPLRRLARIDAVAERAIDPNVRVTAWLADIDDLVRLRNPRAHGRGPEDPSPRRAPLERVDRLYRLVELSTKVLLARGDR